VYCVHFKTDLTCLSSALVEDLTMKGIEQLKETGMIKNAEDKRSLIVTKTNLKVWPYTKFLVPPEIDDVEDGSVCHLLANEFHVSKEMRAIWWNGSQDPRKHEVPVKKIVADKLSEKRSGAAQNMKKKFMGMLCGCNFECMFLCLSHVSRCDQLP
jgi:hypothetical protein